MHHHLTYLVFLQYFANCKQLHKELSTIEQSNKSPQENIGQVNNFLFLCFQFFLLFNILMLVKSCYVLVLNYFKNNALSPFLYFYFTAFCSFSFFFFFLKYSFFFLSFKIQYLTLLISPTNNNFHIFVFCFFIINTSTFLFVNSLLV